MSGALPRSQSLIRP